MKLAQEKLFQDLSDLSIQRDVIVGKWRAAKSKQQVNNVGISQSNVRLSRFEQLEEKANRALLEAEALEQLRKGLDVDMDGYVSPYNKSEDLECELAKLKGELN
ncbi:PspA/IM30 family protein [Paucisalibacillus globulus]|uniref:PspA/IM30 family protein n=1 Tax=Paucisalibacillus globulus TaxID=351095 RepID=UPI00114242F3|nr:hypothetical protein [Paucisalibacillus globulus]